MMGIALLITVFILLPVAAVFGSVIIGLFTGL